TSTPSCSSSTAASRMARACISVISGKVIPRRHPRWPSIGLNSARESSFALMSSRSEEHTSELQSRENLVCRLLLEKKKRVQRAAERGHPTVGPEGLGGLCDPRRSGRELRQERNRNDGHGTHEPLTARLTLPTPNRA